MERAFTYSKEFDKKWFKDLELTDDILSVLEQYLLKNPDAGKIIKGTGGLRKLRWALPDNDKGKSGGVRVLYVDFVSYERIFMIDVYGKNAKENITDAEKEAFKKLIKTITENLRKGL